ncbi:MAG TPA: 16S rRNA (cytosine(1402)-N(4))-methyltransferase RsmH [Phycisphaerae bacterium]|nr:16S rRNA (cytosine(1402)-N(4))-methyltransferase RsmH [Phycisphaerae bacterium]HNU45585.1 16S rRNA (cytosine(1402)-N(4))-methyltransferase RsmH [Phycisphaerae bacterium]
MSGGPTGHTPVLLTEVVELLAPAPGDTVVDCTVGDGGHARALAGVVGPSGCLVGVDVDPVNLDRAGATLRGLPCRVELVHANFSELPEVLAERGLGRAHVLLADLGISSTQLDDPQRGFSFQHDSALDMRLDVRLQVTAADLINRLKERELADLLYTNSQEPGSRAIARAICAARRDRRITTTGELASLIARVLRVDPASRKSKIHPATRCFLALRAAVNDELGALQKLLDLAPQVLASGGRFGVISFHSLEDRLVKNDFRRRQAEGVYELRTKKPVIAGETERRDNPRARSAKLRVAICTAPK